GSFTGANQDKTGLFQAAQGGTLFLDEVAELPMHMQVKLLRAIQERAVRPVGASAEVAIDVRILSASHKNLAALVRDSTFRQDLFYRLNVIELRMPSLREHLDDVPDLVAATFERLSRQSGAPRPLVTPSALQALQRYAFPGNIRELENILERAFTLCENGVIQPDDLLLPATSGVSMPLTAPAAPGPAPIRAEPATLRPGPSTIRPEPATSPVPARYQDEPKTQPMLPMVNNLEGYLEGLEKAAILRALEATRYNKTAAAEKLGISFRALRYRLKKLGLE
ncbi:MAG: sigma-54-dependent Fis family transcriptional regulator, partial [Candidatus Competibacter sp.]|nr:sigma-54-dependent Fis family transcriptional regulator [Candidatus Competibacter sp.]